MVLKILSRNQFYINKHCDLDLWPTEPKNNRDHVLIETNHHVKNEGSAINGSQDIERKPSVTADGLTDYRTDRAKTIRLPQVGGET